VIKQEEQQMKMIVGYNLAVTGVLYIVAFAVASSDAVVFKWITPVAAGCVISIVSRYTHRVAYEMGKDAKQ
jgi:hypothetical protein